MTIIHVICSLIGLYDNINIITVENVLVFMHLQNHTFQSFLPSDAIISWCEVMSCHYIHDIAAWCLVMSHNVMTSSWPGFHMEALKSECLGNHVFLSCDHDPCLMRKKVTWMGIFWPIGTGRQKTKTYFSYPQFCSKYLGPFFLENQIV